MSQQLTIDFIVEKEATLDNFYTKGNQALVQSLTHFVSTSITNPSNSIFFLHGKNGSGRSHLVQAICQKADEQQLAVQFLPLNEHQNLTPEITTGLEQMDLVVLDDIDKLSGQSHWEHSIFDLINRLIENGKRIIVTASRSPANIGIQLPDLVSRLNWGQVWRMKSLNDSQLRQMLKHRASCRGINLSNDVVNYVVQRTRRESRSIIHCLDLLDQSSLQEKRKLTIPFVKSVMDW